MKGSIEITEDVFDFLVNRYNAAVLRLGSNSGDDISFNVVAERFSENVYPITADDISVGYLIDLCVAYVHDNCLGAEDIDLLNDAISSNEVVVFDDRGNSIGYINDNLVLASKIIVFAKIDNVLSMLRDGGK